VRPLTIETLEELISRSDSAAADQRRAAFATFAALPMPSPKDESWRYVELDMDLERYGLAEEPGEPIADDAFVGSVEDAVGRATIVDGYVTSVEHDSKAAFEARLDLTDFDAPDGDKFAAASLAFAGEGVVLDVPNGTTVERPFIIDIQATQSGVISFPSVNVRLGDDAEASVLVLMRSSDGAVAQAPSITLHAGNAARLRYTNAQVMGGEAINIVRQRVHAGSDATIRLGEVGLGGTFSRVDLGVALEGNGSSVEVVGLYFGEHEQVIDYRMVMDHVGRNTSSDVFLKGAVEDDARSVFTGLLRIEKDAVRTSAFETNRNLVLSPGAKAHSVPNLEILCDDVICGHGSSVGPLEEDHLYYLQSRGISRARAERLLIRGFFSEVIDRLPSTRLAGPIRDVVYRRFSEAQQAGRIAT
jgi:Fe-S cluster assembly protein SufD